MLIKNRFLLILLFLFTSSIIITSCSDDNDDNIEINSDDDDTGDDDDDTGDDDDDTGDDDDDDTTNSVDRNSLATNGCQNVVIVNGFAYAACGQEIEVINLATLERNLLNISGDDITADADMGLLFTLDLNVINVLSLQDPLNPSMIATTNTNFSAFSGIGAANGVLVVSAGAGSADTQIFTYTNTTISLATDGNNTIDNVTGNPDVHVTPNSNGGLTAFYSQDIGAVANWAIQIADINANGEVVNTPPSVVLTPRQFTGGPFGPSNFPVESEFLNDRLYVAHFGVPGVEIIDLSNNQLLSPINLSYTPVNIATDGSQLFIIGPTNNDVDVIDPDTNTIVDSIDAALVQSTGVAANNNHIAVADRSDGLIVITRE